MTTGADAFVRSVADALREMFAARRRLPAVESVSVEGTFPVTTLVVRFGDRGYRCGLFTEEESQAPLGTWSEIQERYPMFRDAGRLAIELKIAIEEGLDTQMWDDDYSEADRDGVRWIVV